MLWKRGIRTITYHNASLPLGSRHIAHVTSLVTSGNPQQPTAPIVPVSPYDTGADMTIHKAKRFDESPSTMPGALICPAQLR